MEWKVWFLVVLVVTVIVFWKPVQAYLTGHFKGGKADAMAQISSATLGAVESAVTAAVERLEKYVSKSNRDQAVAITGVVTKHLDGSLANGSEHSPARIQEAPLANGPERSPARVQEAPLANGPERSPARVQEAPLANGPERSPARVPVAPREVGPGRTAPGAREAATARAPESPTAAPAVEPIKLV